MRLNFCLWLSLFCVCAQAQIIYTYNDGPKAGIKIKKGNLLASAALVAELSKDGTNEIWDVQNAIKDTSTSDDEYEYKLASDVPNITQFPSANLASVPSDPDPEIEYYTRNQSGLTFLGIYAGVDDFIKLKKGLLVTPYPLQFGMTFPDNDSALINLGGVVLETDINTNTMVIGWGEIKTPTGSFLCLKVKNIQIWEGFEGGTQRLSSTIESNAWLASNNASPVAQLTIQEIVLDTFTIQDTAITFLIQQSVISKNEDHKKSAALFNLIPSTAEEKLIVNISNSDFEKIQLTIVDAQSKIIFQSKFQQEKQISLSTSSWPAGTYLVHLVFDDQEMAFEKFIKN